MQYRGQVAPMPTSFSGRPYKRPHNRTTHGGIAIAGGERRKPKPSPRDQGRTGFEVYGEESGSFVKAGVTGLSALDAGLQLAMGDTAGADKTITEGYNVPGVPDR